MSSQRGETVASDGRTTKLGQQTKSPFVISSPLPDQDIPCVPYYEYVWSKSDKWMNKDALVCGITGKTVTFGELRKQCKQFCTVVRSRLGLSPGDVIATILPNCLEYPPAILGSWEAGLIVTTVDVNYTPSELAKQLKDSGAKAAVTIPDKFSVVREAITKLELKGFHVILTGPPDAVQGLSALSFDILMNDVGQSFVSSTQGHPDDTIYMPYSSGTTGIPKGVCLTNKNLVSILVIISTSHHFQETTDSHQEVVPLIRPCSHAYGAIIMGIAIHFGAKLIVLKELEETTFIRALRDHKASVLYAVPYFIQYIITNESISASDLKSLKTVLSAAAPLAESDVRRLIQKSGRSLAVRQLYGATEAPTLCSGQPDDKFGSIGRPSVNTQMKIIEPGGSGEPLGPGLTGEICVRGPQIMKCYLNNEKATVETIDADGWFHTGDLGHYDTDNYFFVTGRLKEVIKVNGFQVSPSEVEAVLRTHSNILDVGIVGGKHPTNGETPIAFVVVKESHLWSEDEVKDFLRQQLTSLKIPSKFIIVGDIPKSRTGKILRRELQAMVGQF